MYKNCTRKSGKIQVSNTSLPPIFGTFCLPWCRHKWASLSCLPVPAARPRNNSPRDRPMLAPKSGSYRVLTCTAPYAPQRKVRGVRCSAAVSPHRAPGLNRVQVSRRLWIPFSSFAVNCLSELLINMASIVPWKISSGNSVKLREQFLQWLV